MSHGTRGQLGRNQGHDDPEGSGLPPPPTMAQVPMEIERNRRDSHALLEVIARNSTQQRNEMVTLNDFIHLHPPVFSYSTEALEADDWLRRIERKLQVGRVADNDKVTYATTPLREQQALGGRITSTCVPKVHPRHGTSFALRSVSTTYPRV